VTAAQRAEEQLLELTPERAIGVAGYSAGLTDFEAGQPARRPRHRAAASTSAAGMSELSAARPATAGTATAEAARPEPFGTPEPAGAPRAAAAPAGTGDTFHDEVVRTTADLDMMLALAGVTGTAVPGSVPGTEDFVVPDTPEGAEPPPPAQATAGDDDASPRRPHAVPLEDAAGSAEPAHHRPPEPAYDTALPLLDPSARAAKPASPGMDDTSIITRDRLVD
jgi:hypothetical protein